MRIQSRRSSVYWPRPLQVAGEQSHSAHPRVFVTTQLGISRRSDQSCMDS